MARTPTPDGRRVPLSLKLTEAEAAQIDAVRGQVPRSAYFRQAGLAALGSLPLNAVLPGPASIAGRPGAPKRDTGIPDSKRDTGIPELGRDTGIPESGHPEATRTRAADAWDCRHPGTARKARCKKCGRYNLG